ncbi:hypothetical protein M427DRAFT_144728 [Gonapodya prolifera JEL478]|uniref:VOC domain-containing protein n=1 Tax=Gonapodya prolifera (strain JEL478) TaxID=1344416 RepID=A0A139AIS2_GONPJ|nr:hypothetical protein M427DRAFT_144728 [Gonapodya prolifera JEL478]|eukprot:KXS16701.1 hypothetical protein M427DRAFT_144728 [Gonapodya prolifera JEL478]
MTPPKVLLRSIDWPADFHTPAVCVLTFTDYHKGNRKGADQFIKGWEDYYFAQFAKHLQSLCKRYHEADDDGPEQEQSAKKAKAKTAEEDGGAKPVDDGVPELAKHRFSFVCQWDIPVRDVERASKFYTDVFGWTVTPWCESYALFSPNSNDKKTVIRGHLLLPGGFYKVPPSKTIAPDVKCYLAVEDIDVASAKVVKAGGKKVGNKDTIKGDPGGGKELLFEDTEGNAHYLYEYGTPKSRTKWSKTGPGDGAPMYHIEIPSKDDARFRSFYGDLFGRSFGEMDMPGSDEKYKYWMWNGSQTDKRSNLTVDGLGGGLIPAPADDSKKGTRKTTASESVQQRLFLWVPDVSAWEKKMVEKGGKVVNPRVLSVKQSDGVQSVANQMGTKSAFLRLRDFLLLMFCRRWACIWHCFVVV